MRAYEEVQQLHDRVTRGEQLSEEEQAHLDAWYASQDRLEMRELGLPAQERTITTLHAQVETALRQLRTVTQCIQHISAENDTRPPLPSRGNDRDFTSPGKKIPFL